MTKLKKRSNLIVIACVLFLLVFMGVYLSRERLRNDQPLQKRLPVSTLNIPSPGEIGIDYYHESMGYVALRNEEIERDLDLISQVTHKLKVYHNPLASPLPQPGLPASLSIVKNIVHLAKAHHMYVVWTENDDTVKLTDTSWQAYASAVIADATQAYSAGADEFLVGNEISIHNNGDPGFSDEKLPLRIKKLVEDCKMHFPGPRSYEDGWYKSDSWHKAGLGPLDKIYFTLYEPWHTFQNAVDRIIADFGKRAELGEVSTMTTMQGLRDNDQAWTRDLLRRYDYTRQKAIPIWLFTFREPENNSFGLLQAKPELQAHDIWSYLIGKKKLAYTRLLANNFQDGTTQAFRGDGSNFHQRLRLSTLNAQAIAPLSLSDYVFRGVFRSISTSGPETWRAMRLIIHYKDANNYFYLNIEMNDHRIRLFKRQNGRETVLADVSLPLHFDTDYDFEMRISGRGLKTALQVFWNTVQLFAVYDPMASALASGGVGLKNSGIVGELSNVVVTSPEQ